MRLVVNGAEQDLDVTTVADLFEALEIRQRFVAVEVNREIVPRSEHASTELAEGDRVEIVTMVGGG